MALKLRRLTRTFTNAILPQTTGAVSLKRALGSDIPYHHNFVLARLSAYHRADHDLQEEDCAYDARGLQCVRAPPLVGADLHGVHLRPGHTTSAAVALEGHPVWDARHGVRGDDHRMPFLDLTSAPDPDDVGRLENESGGLGRRRQVDATRFPGSAAAAYGE